MCDCVAKVNEQLADHNTVLEEVAVVSMTKPGMRSSMLITTSRLRTSTQNERRSKVKKVMPSFCPFCGEKIDRRLKSGAEE